MAQSIAGELGERHSQRQRDSHRQQPTPTTILEKEENMCVLQGTDEQDAGE